MIQFYDLVNKPNGKHFSPFAWRSVMALKHKSIDFEHHSFKVASVKEEITKLSNGEWNKIPFIKFDDGSYIYDSPKIAIYLEANYPENPLFPNGRHFATFLENSSCNFLPLFRSVVLDIYNSIEDEKDRKYFRDSRQALYRTSLENLAGKKEDHKVDVEKMLLSYRITLADSKFLEGDKVTYSDYILFGHLKFVQMASIETFNAIVTNHKDPSLNNWFSSIQNLYGGYAASFKP
ncbi:hypothetical protein K502DRAFT_316401 [Neoconidiobolus thromboides FSU 785]|nr:hypothetical protein K502DRAFT_316401 [Neoconidiobolus thromboides FSU 785]